MRKVIYSSLALFSALLMTAANVSATSYGDNITIYDGTEDASHTGTGTGREDNETEPGMVNNQLWDLEGFFQNGNTLSMVGGYNFATGKGGYNSGDIFIDTNASYGKDDTFTSNTSGNQEIQNNFGYEYVLDLNFTDNTYNVYALNGYSYTVTAWFPANENDTPGSNPWRYSKEGSLISQNNSFSFTNQADITDTTLSVNDTHYAVTGLDLSFMPAGIDFVAHFTMGCGNDNLMGSGTTAPVPEPATMMLFGTGITGLAALQRRKFRKK